MKEERVQQQIKITRDSDAAIDIAMKKLGMTKIEMLSRVCGWFAAQSSLTQKLVLGLVDDELMDAAKDALVKTLTASNVSSDAVITRETAKKLEKFPELVSRRDKLLAEIAELDETKMPTQRAVASTPEGRAVASGVESALRDIQERDSKRQSALPLQQRPRRSVQK